MRSKWRSRIYGTMCLSGLMLMFGTAGASDLNMISLSQIKVQMIIGMALFVGGGYLGGILR